MKRRSLILSVGAVATGGAAIGTGAFTTAEAERTLNIEVAEENTAILSLSQVADNDTGDFVQVGSQNNELSFDFNDTPGTGGEGVGTDSTYRFDRLFAVENQGAQTVYFEADFPDEESDFGEELENIGIYVEEADADEFLLDGENAVLELGVGEAAELGFKIDTDGIDVNILDDFTLDSTVSATGEEPDGVTILNTDGEETNGGGVG